MARVSDNIISTLYMFYVTALVVKLRNNFNLSPTVSPTTLTTLYIHVDREKLKGKLKNILRYLLVPYEKPNIQTTDTDGGEGIWEENIQFEHLCLGKKLKLLK